MCKNIQEQFACGHLFGTTYLRPYRYIADNRLTKRRHPNWEIINTYHDRVLFNEGRCAALAPSFEYKPREGFCPACTAELRRGPYQPEYYIPATGTTPAHIRLGAWRNLNLSDAQRNELARIRRLEEQERKEWKDAYEGQLKEKAGEEELDDEMGQHLYIPIKKKEEEKDNRKGGEVP